MCHNLCDFIKDELGDLDRKIEEGGKLSMQEMQYADLLGHAKKNLLAADAMEGQGYESPYPRTYPQAYRRGRYMGAYRDDGMIEGLRELIDKAPNERARRRLESLMADMERM